MRPPLRLAVAGEAEHGKSTLIGRLLLDTGSLDRERRRELEGLGRDLGADAPLAFLVDRLKEERERGHTLDASQAVIRHRGKELVLIDLPGQSAFLKGMMTGAARTGAALLVLDASRGIGEQTGRHAYLLRLLGARTVVAALSKMDLVGFSAAAFRRRERELSRLLRGRGLELRCAVPVSAVRGEGLLSRSRRMPWHKGPALLPALGGIEPPRIPRGPFRFTVQDVYREGRKKVAVGGVASGCVRAGQRTVSLPSGKRSRVRSIEVFGRRKSSARQGESVGLVLDPPDAAERGTVLAPVGCAPRPAVRFEGTLFWIGEEPLRRGRRYVCRCATQSSRAEVAEVRGAVDTSSRDLAARPASSLRRHEAARVAVRTETPLAIEPCSELLGRFVLEGEDGIVGVGVAV